MADQRYVVDDSLEIHLDRWTQAGLVTGGQAEAIRRYEVPPALPNNRSFVRAGGALAALAAGLVLSAAGVAAAYHWAELALATRIAVSLGVAVVLLAAGVATRRRGSTDALDLVTGALWAGSAAVVALLIVIIVGEGFGLGTGAQALLAGTVAGIYAVPLWQARPAGLQQAVVAAGLATALAGAIWSIPRLRHAAVGVGLWVLGAAWFVGVRSRLVVPERTGQVLTVALILGGAQMVTLQAPSAGAIVGIVSAVLLLALSVTIGSRVLLVAGGLGAFAFTAQVVAQHAAENLAVLATLALVGLAGLAGAYVLLRAGVGGPGDGRGTSRRSSRSLPEPR